MINITRSSESSVENDKAKACRRIKRNGEWYSEKGDLLLPQPPTFNKKKYYVWQCWGKWDRFERTHDASCRHANVKASILEDGNRDWPFMDICDKCRKNCRIKTSGDSKFIVAVYENKQQAYAHAYGINQAIEMGRGEEE